MLLSTMTNHHDPHEQKTFTTASDYFAVVNALVLVGADQAGLGLSGPTSGLGRPGPPPPQICSITNSALAVHDVEPHCTRPVIYRRKHCRSSHPRHRIGFVIHGLTPSTGKS